MTLALYRKYRPGTFAEVVGQDHVTEPLAQALRSGRIHHAYLFSGPRGCGKTSSARILARSLNCEQGPTPTPCGECDSCVALAPNGAGSIDVIEIDAASHNGVDDARELREKAFYAPVSSLYKIYIVDEAHMVTAQAFNALLKVVEEPPPHVKFIFATTEPDKVLSTIKSRTFHYRFRLIPPSTLREFLAGLCAREGIEVEPSVLPLVVRAGAGSARDALSVLDQLAAGAGDGGITYERAVAILGFTDAALLDETVDAFSAGDGAAVFGAIDRVIEAGLDPRRFAQDLLERFRDLLVLDAVPDAGEAGVLEAPADALDRMRGQSARFGRAPLTRAASVMSQALVDMRGTTSPRLVLELACARVLLPAAASDELAVLTRLDRLERRLAVAPPSTAPAPAAPAPTRTPEPKPATTPTETPATPVAETAAEPATADGPAPSTEPAAVPTEATTPPPTPSAPGDVDVAAVRRLWDDVLDAVKQRNRSAHAMLRQYAEVTDVAGRTLTLSFSNANIGKQFDARSEFLREALREVAGIDLQVRTTSGAASAAKLDDPPDVVDLSDDTATPDEDGEPADPVALLQRDLGAQVIGEIDDA